MPPAVAPLLHCAAMSMRNRPFRRSLAWIACLAILINAFAPLAMRAAQAADGGTMAYMEFCSAKGIERVAIEPGQEAPAGPALNGDRHCPFCASHGGVFTLPSSPLPRLASALHILPTAAPVSATPRPPPSWPAARPRAPPSLA